VDLLLTSVEILLDFDIVLALFVGTIGGMVVGALPGFTAAMGVSLLLPLTFGMEPIPSMVMLTALYTSAIYGGSISAILIHTPGTPASGATADDGFELTKQGLGLQALGVSTICSCIGGIMSGLALLFIAPPLAEISLLFGPAEYLFVAFFGLTIIGSLCSGGIVKGLVCAAFGLAISCIGIDTDTQYPRFMYGSIQLGGGLGMVPLLIGLFSISQVMIMAEKSSASIESGSVAPAFSLLKGKILLPLKDWINLIIPSIRSSIIGVAIGILPGAGADIASYIAYNSGKQGSKHPELYGKGSFEAVACSEAANNAVCGGSLIPLMTLSIPGSGTAAILLGGLTMHGLIPGGELFSVCL
jgi:putative tricarboxylic transport membrane protein